MTSAPVTAPVSQQRRNPGPSWGYGFLVRAERRWPRWLFRAALQAGTWIALAKMPVQRRHSRAYLGVVLGRPPRLIEQWRHFFALAGMLLLKLRAGHGAAVRCSVDPRHAPDFWTLVRSEEPAFFGTFHFGGSDMLGYLLSDHGRRVSMVRVRVANSDDTRLLADRFGGQVSILWANDPAGVLFELKSAIESGASIAMQCDRLEPGAKVEPFQFLGARRRFPFSIYHLAILFGRPVMFCVAIPHPQTNELRVFASPVFRPDPALSREGNLPAARRHFQAVLTEFEQLVREYPLFWFNFLPLNPVVSAPGPSGAEA